VHPEAVVAHIAQPFVLALVARQQPATNGVAGGGEAPADRAADAAHAAVTNTTRFGTGSIPTRRFFFLFRLAVYRRRHGRRARRRTIEGKACN